MHKCLCIFLASLVSLSTVTPTWGQIERKVSLQNLAYLESIAHETGQILCRGLAPYKNDPLNTLAAAEVLIFMDEDFASAARLLNRQMFHSAWSITKFASDHDSLISLYSNSVQTMVGSRGFYRAVQECAPQYNEDPIELYEYLSSELMKADAWGTITGNLAVYTIWLYGLGYVFNGVARVSKAVVQSPAMGWLTNSFLARGINWMRNHSRGLYYGFVIGGLGGGIYVAHMIHENNQAVLEESRKDIQNQGIEVWFDERLQNFTGDVLQSRYAIWAKRRNQYLNILDPEVARSPNDPANLDALIAQLIELRAYEALLDPEHPETAIFTLALGRLEARRDILEQELNAFKGSLVTDSEPYSRSRHVCIMLDMLHLSENQAQTGEMDHTVWSTLSSSHHLYNQLQRGLTLSPQQQEELVQLEAGLQYALEGQSVCEGTVIVTNSGQSHELRIQF